MNARLPLRAILGLALLTLLASGAARAELYKWVDDEGNVTYSEVAPPDREAKTIAPPPPPAGARTPKKDEGEPEAGGAESPSEETSPRAQAEEKDKMAKEIARLAKENCDIAQRNLEIYKTFNRVRNDKGEITVLDDATRATKVREEEQNVKIFCK